MQEDLSSLKIRINDLNKLLQTQAVLNDNESKKRLTDELDKTLYKYYKTLINQMRNMDGNGDGI